MKKILIIKPTEVLKRDDFNNFVDYINNKSNDDILVLNKNMEYELVEVGDLETKPINIAYPQVWKNFEPSVTYCTNAAQTVADNANKSSTY